MVDRLTIGGTEVPFAVFGLDGDPLIPMSVGGVGRHGETINLVSLDHGDRWTAPHEWVQVTVIGPLQGVSEHGAWSIDPMPMIGAELLNATGAVLSTGEELRQAVDDVIERDFADAVIDVDGTGRRFEVTHEGPHWAALRRVEPDHLLYVVASNVPLSRIALRRLRDLRGYSQRA